MALINKLENGQSTLTAFNGETPNKYDKESGLVNGNIKIVASDSGLDLDGNQPTTYRDTAPENQGGKI